MGRYKKYVPGIIYCAMLAFAFKRVFTPVAERANSSNILGVMFVAGVSAIIEATASTLLEKNISNTFEEYVVEFVNIVAMCVFLACLLGMFHWEWAINLLSW